MTDEQNKLLIIIKFESFKGQTKLFYKQKHLRNKTSLKLLLKNQRKKLLGYTSHCSKNYQNINYIFPDICSNIYQVTLKLQVVPSQI